MFWILFILLHRLVWTGRRLHRTGCLLMGRNGCCWLDRSCGWCRRQRKWSPLRFFFFLDLATGHVASCRETIRGLASSALENSDEESRDSLLPRRSTEAGRARTSRAWRGWNCRAWEWRNRLPQSHSGQERIFRDGGQQGRNSGWDSLPGIIPVDYVTDHVAEPLGAGLLSCYNLKQLKKLLNITNRYILFWLGFAQL